MESIDRHAQGHVLESGEFPVNGPIDEKEGDVSIFVR